MQYIIVSVIVLVTLIFIPDFHHPYHSPKNLLFISIMPISLLFYFVHSYIKNKKLIFSIGLIDILLFIRLLWLILGNPSYATHPSNLGFWIFISLILLSFLTRQIVNELKSETKYLILLIKSIWIVGIIQLIVGFIQYAKYFDISKSILKTPLIGSIGFINGFGLFMVIALIAIISDYLYIKQQKFKLVFAIMFLIVIVLNGSRGAILGLISAIMIVVYIFYADAIHSRISRRVKQLKFKTFKKIILYGFVLGLSLILLFLINLNRESSFGRIMIWKISLPMITENPVTGIGQGNYARDYIQYQADYLIIPENSHLAYKAATLMQAHNEYIQAFCESGIFGGLIFMTIWIVGLVFLIRLSKKNRLYIGFLTIYITVLIHSLVDAPLHVLPISVIMYAILGLARDKLYLIDIKNKFIVGFILIFFSIVSLFTVNKSFSQSKGYISWKYAVQADRSQQFSIAIPKYEKALKQLPEQGELLFNLGANYSSVGEFTKGIFYLEKSLEYLLDRNQLLSLSQSYMNLKDNTKAEHYAIKAKQCFPDHLVPKFLLGVIYYRQGRYDDSKKMFDICINEETYIKSEVTKRVREMAITEKKRLYGE